MCIFLVVVVLFSYQPVVLWLEANKHEDEKEEQCKVLKLNQYVNVFQRPLIFFKYWKLDGAPQFLNYFPCPCGKVDDEPMMSLTHSIVSCTSIWDQVILRDWEIFGKGFILNQHSIKATNQSLPYSVLNSKTRHFWYFFQKNIAMPIIFHILLWSARYGLRGF